MELTVREVVSLLRQDAEVTKAMFYERVSLFGSVDYKFMQYYFELLAQRLRLLEKALDDQEKKYDV